MNELEGAIAAITGAGRGIGEALARELAERGCRIAVSDVDRESVEETAEAIRRSGGEAIADRVDVSERRDVYDWADRVVSEFGGVHLIVNNAGVSVTATVEALEYEDFEWLMETNFWGVVHGTKAFLPHIRETGRGRVVNISSAFGLVASPTQSAYNASKFAVRGFTESLRGELALDDGSVDATCVHPGGVHTGIIRDSRVGDTGPMNRSREDVVEEFENVIARISPADAAEAIADGIEAGDGRILVGVDARLADLVQRLFPARYPGPMAHFARRQWGA